MNGWDIAIIMTIAGSVLYLFACMVNCFIKRLNDSKKAESNGNLKIDNDE